MATQNRKAAFSIPSILAIVAAIGSFTAGAGWAFMLACVAIGFGIIGVVLSLSPSIRGGIISTIGIVAGALGIIASIFKIVF